MSGQGHGHYREPGVCCKKIRYGRIEKFVPSELLTLLLETGLLQFGWFDEERVPFQLNLDLLPSYPDVLAQLVEYAAPLVGQVDHLISVPSALPFGVSLSLKTGVPLVYSRGIDNSTPAYDLVGAYDIGHPALLIANDQSHSDKLASLMNNARQVGLEIERLLIIVDDGKPGHEKTPITSLVHLPTAVGRLVETGQLPPGHARAVERWLQTRYPLNPHPG